MDFIITKTSTSLGASGLASPSTVLTADLASQTPVSSPLPSVSNSTWSKSTITSIDLSPLPTTLVTSLLSNTTSSKDLDAKLLAIIAHDNVPCYNDQGFSVNCATWTGYRYTWPEPYGGATALAGTGTEDAGSGSGSSAASSSVGTAFGVSSARGARGGWKISWAVVLVVFAMFVTGGLAVDVSRSRQSDHPAIRIEASQLLLPQWSVMLLSRLPTAGLERLA